MHIKVGRSELLGALQSVIGVVERRQSLPILGNVLLEVHDDELSVTATDLELQSQRKLPVQNVAPGKTTVPARKLHDICRGLPEGSEISLVQEDARLVVRSGKSRYLLATLPAEDYPAMVVGSGETTLKVASKLLSDLIRRTQFAIAQQDVRYYLNGLLLEARGERLRSVATDGHRLAMAETMLDSGSVSGDFQVIVPRKAIMELQRLLAGNGETIDVRLSSNQIEVSMPGVTLLSKLIEGRFPDYERVIPESSDKRLEGSKSVFRSALSRASILSNEKFRGVRLSIEDQVVRIQTQNPDQEEAHEEVEVDYGAPALEIGFNVNYLLDALDALDGERFVLELRGADSSGLIYEPAQPANKFVVMPMRI